VSAWAAFDAPFDSAGEGGGEERAPAALRRAGLIERVGCEDLEWAAPVLRPPERDSRTGIVAFPGLVAASEAIAGKLGEVLDSGRRPLVLGGDCSLLVGVAGGLRRSGLEAGLLFVDGHADYFDGESSTTGEAADMELAILHGDGPAELTGSNPPLVAPERTTIFGHRPPDLDPDVAHERSRVPDAVIQLDAPAIRRLGAAEAARTGIERGTGAGGELWLHLDLDALDEAELPAVSYPQPQGLSWQELEDLIRPMVDAGPVGISVADYNPDLDPDGRHAARIVELLSRLLGGTT